MATLSSSGPPAVANTTSARPLSPSERDEAIQLASTRMVHGSFVTFRNAFSFLETADVVRAGGACRIFNRWHTSHISSISFSLAKVTDEYLAMMGNGGALTSLASVSFMRCVSMSVAGVSAFSAGYPSLTSVNFELCSTDLPSALTVLAHCPALKTLGLRYNDAVDGSAADMRAFAAACGGLHTLSLRGSRMMRHLNAHGLFSRGTFASLTSLDLGVMPNVTSDTLSAISAACPALTHVNLERCRFECLLRQSLLSSRGSLFATLVNGMGGRLLHLNVAGCALGGVIESDVLFALARCPNLERIDLSAYLGAIGAAEGAALGTSCPKLTHVCLARSKRATPLGIAELARNAPELRSLDVSSSTTCDIVDSSVILRALGAHSRKLEHLNVSCVPFF